MAEFSSLVAVLVALGAALASAIGYLCIRVGTDSERAGDAVFVVILVNVIVLLPTVGLVYYPDYGLTRTSILSFVAAGFVGTILGRLFTFTSIATIGASRTTPITASWALVSTVLGVVVLGESLRPVHGLGVVLTVVGVSVIAWETSHENPHDLPRRELLIGLAIPFAGAIAYGVEPIAASVGLGQGTPAPVGLAVKTVAAWLGFTLYLRWRGALPDVGSIRSGRTSWLLAAGVANTLFLLGYYVGLSLAPVNVVTPILTTQTLFVVVLSAFLMPRRLERVTWRLAAAAGVVVVGVVLVTFFG